MEMLSALLVLCDRKPLDTSGFPSQGPVMQGLDVFPDVNLNNSWLAGDLGRYGAHEMLL